LEDFLKLEKAWKLKPLGGDTNRLLTDEQEDALEKWVLQRAAVDACIHVLALKQKAARLAGVAELPSSNWVSLFLERRPQLSKRKGQMVSEERRGAFTKEALDDMQKKLTSLSRNYSIKHPYQVVVMDESGTYSTMTKR
jgi:hypothetical protein